jgi:hypothetical protein
MSTLERSRFFGLAAILGGIMWVVKAGSILVMGVQPPLIFELGQFLFAIGLVGLYHRLEGRANRWGRAGLALAYLAMASLLGIALYILSGGRLPGGEEFLFPVSLFFMGAALGIFGGLILLGIATLSAKTMPRPWRTLPLAIGLLPIPVAATALLHLELPILLLGLAWAGLGYMIWVGPQK